MCLCLCLYFVCLFFHPPMCLSVYPSICMSDCLSTSLSICLFIYLPVYPPLYLCLLTTRAYHPPFRLLHLNVSLSVCLFVSPSSQLTIHHQPISSFACFHLILFGSKIKKNKRVMMLETKLCRETDLIAGGFC